MSANYQDDLRRALGVPTTAEKERTRLEAESKRKALEEDQPRRKALVAEFRATVGAMITVAFNDAVEPFKEARLTITEVTISGTFPDILVHRMFVCGHVQVHGARAPIMGANFPSLSFTLSVDGRVTVNISRNHSVQPAQVARFVPIEAPLKEITADVVRKVFSNYGVAIQGR